MTHEEIKKEIMKYPKETIINAVFDTCLISVKSLMESLRNNEAKRLIKKLDQLIGDCEKFQEERYHTEWKKKNEKIKAIHRRLDKLLKL